MLELLSFRFFFFYALKTLGLSKIASAAVRLAGLGKVPPHRLSERDRAEETG